MKKEIIPIEFKEGRYNTYDESLKQWNHSQQLAISGLDISDEIVEVHFSLQERDGTAKRMVGTVIDGVIHVGIPVFILEGPEWSSEYYNAYAWIYLSDEESAETVRKIEFTIEARPKPDEYATPEELTFLQQLELAIQNKLDKSGHAPNKFLGTDEQGNVVTKEQEEFSLEVADEEKLGGVKPLNKTDDMTLEVGVDKDGRLFAKGKDITVDSELDEESENPVQNKVLTKEVITLKEHNTQLKETIEKLQIKVTTEKASFHNIKDSANMKVLDFGMEGKTEQETTSGKNVFNPNLIPTTFWTVNKDVISTTGTEVVTRVDVSCKENTQYFLYVQNINVVDVGRAPSSNFYGMQFSFIYSDGTSKGWYIVKAGKKYIVDADKTITAIEINNPWNVVIEYTGLVVAENTLDATYEPYTNGPSPNPDYPQEIVNAGVYNEETGRYEHKFGFVNKNHWDAEYARDESNWINLGGYDCIPIYVGKGSIVTLSYIQTLSLGLDFYVSLSKNGLNSSLYGWLYHSASNVAKNPFTITAENDYIYVCCYENNATDKSIFMQYIGNDLQIEIADAPTDFTEHQSQPFTLTSDRPITMWDKMIKRDGVWGWSVNSKNRQLDASHLDYTNTHGWSEFTDANTPEGVTTFVIGMFDKAYGFANIYCDTFRMKPSSAYSKDAEKNTCSGISSGYRIFFSTDGLTMDEWKTYIDENPLNIWYQTAEEQSFHPLPDEEQELLNNLETYYGVTNLYNDQGCPTWLTYIADPKLYLDNQLLEIKSAIV